MSGPGRKLLTAHEQAVAEAVADGILIQAAVLERDERSIRDGQIIGALFLSWPVDPEIPDRLRELADALESAPPPQPWEWADS